MANNDFILPAYIRYEFITCITFNKVYIMESIFKYFEYKFDKCFIFGSDRFRRLLLH